jgi:hypothetical protein
MKIEALKQLHIIPRTPSPSRSLSPEDEEENDEVDAESNAAGLTLAEQRQLKALMAKMNKGRRGGSAAAGGSKRIATRIKKEHVESRGLGGRAPKRARKEAPMMIDLTGDDDEDVEVEDENELFVS